MPRLLSRIGRRTPTAWSKARLESQTRANCTPHLNGFFRYNHSHGERRVGMAFQQMRAGLTNRRPDAGDVLCLGDKPAMQIERRDNVATCREFIGPLGDAQLELRQGVIRRLYDLVHCLG